MSMFRRRNREIPELNTSSLPDLIFTVLFFFMIVTHMRQVAVRVKYKVPEGRELARLVKKPYVYYLYIGKQMKGGLNSTSGRYYIQLNDKFVTTSEIVDYLDLEQRKMSPENKEKLVVSIKADKNVPMYIVYDVKEALQNAGIVRVNLLGDDVK